jgi:hypothetical protein
VQDLKKKQNPGMHKSYQCVMTNLGEQVETQPILHPSCAASTLSSITFGNERFDQTTELALFVKPKGSQ